MKKIYLLLLSFNFVACFAQNANNKMPDNLYKEIQDTRFAGDIVVKSYDTVKVGSTWVRDRISYVRLDLNANQSTKLQQTNNIVWPKVGDTCLVIVDRKCENGCVVKSFATIKKDKYVFWDPYSTSTKDPSFEMDRKEFWVWYKKNNWQFASKN